ncbi:hypothetical protein DTO013F2_9754 [Penicillium roqueforti]|nr:hypothetical protein DTO013F2_9754 [Penicillium roqueforti]KAI3127426.1 hypothetical protein CBS147326_7216 [Penicillium roqueforti]
MSCSPFNAHGDPLFDSYDQSDHSPLFAPTPGYGVFQTPSVMSATSPEHRPDDDFPSQHQTSQLGQIPLLQLTEWEEGRLYDELPPKCLHYSIVWKVTLNNKPVRKNTEQDLVLAPRYYWRLFLEPKLNELLGKKFHQKTVELDDTTIVVSVNHRNQPDLTLSCDKTDVDWPAVEKQLLVWGDCFRDGKKLTLNMSFNYTDSSNALKSVPRSTDKRGTSSATQRMLLQRHEEINAAEEATGQPPAWDHVYSLMRCSSRACELGPHCWRDSISKKHIKLTVQNLRGLVDYVDQGGVLTSHDDVPETIREQLYIQEQQRLERQKGGLQSSPGYPPINITNVLPAQSSNLSALSTPTPMVAMCPGKTAPDFLEIPGLRDLAVTEYSDWQQSQVSDEKLKAEFRKARDTALEDGLDLMQVHEDQDPEFFIKNGVKRGIARRFVGDISYWVKNCKCNMESGFIAEFI